jgi:hypothetical protein
MNNEGNNEINLAMVHSFITKQAAKRFVENTSKGVIDTLRKAASADMEETGEIVEKIEKLVDEETCKAVSKSILESERFMNIYKNFLNDTCDLVKRELENQEVSPDKKGMH